MPKPNPYRSLNFAPDLTPPRHEPWMDSAVCAQVDPDLFYEASTERYDLKASGVRESIAKGVCARCPVSAECLDYALAADERFGIWGGYTERERRGMKRRPA